MKIMSIATPLLFKRKKFEMMAFLLVLIVIMAPLYVSAFEIVPCGGSGQSACNFSFFIQLIRNVVKFLIFYLAVPLAAISFAVAGVMILTSGGNTGQVEQAKEIFWNVLIGLIVALAAWLVVNAILIGLGAKQLGSF